MKTEDSEEERQGGTPQAEVPFLLKTNYGADTCIKYEVDMGLYSRYTGTYYVACDAVNCCKGNAPDVKKWDIGQSKSSTIS